MTRTHRTPVVVFFFAAVLAFGSIAGADVPTSKPITLSSVALAPDVTDALNARFFKYQVGDLPLEKVDRQLAVNRLRIQLDSRDFELVLEPNHILAEDYRSVLIGAGGETTVLEPPAIRTYKGRIAGDPDSIVRLSRHPDGLEGYVHSKEDWIFIESLRRHDPRASASKALIYRVEDARSLEAGGCELNDTRDHHTLAESVFTPSLKAASSNGTLELATDSDGEYTQQFGQSGARSRIISVINGVDGIYEKDHDISISIVFSVLWADPDDDPYTEVNGFNRLQEGQQYWNANFSWVNRDNTYLFTGEDIWSPVSGFGLIGRAFDFGTICAVPGESYEIGEDRSVTSQEIWLAAHEIGHSFDARHSNNCPGVNCGGSGPIMCSSLQPNSNNCFASCPISEIANHVANNGGCL